MSRITITLLFALLLSCSSFAQTIPEPTATPEKNATEDADKLRKDAVAFLRESLSDVSGMRSLENRISFTAEMAGLMWYYDEREARSMYTGVIGDYRDLLARYESQLNSLGGGIDDGEVPGPMSFMVEPTEKGRIIRKFTIALGVGQSIANSLAEHDAELAYNFYYDSLSSIANPELRKQADNGNNYFESQLLGVIAETNASKAAQLAAKSPNKDVTYAHVELLKKIYKKDADKGAEFGASLASRIKAKKLKGEDFYSVRNLINFGGETLEASRKANGKRPVFSDSELRELVEYLAQAILNDEDGQAVAMEYVDLIKKYSPGRAAQIRTKFKLTDGGSYGSSAANRAAVLSSMGVGSNANSNANSSANGYASRREQEQREAEEREKKVLEDMQKLGKKELPKEERQRIVEQSRKIILMTPGRDKKIMALSSLAATVANAGDKELAGEIMKDAEALVNPAPKNYQDFLLNWMLASGYANSDPEKAFPILEETIGRANDTLAAFVKIGEFIDVAEEMIVDGEVQVGAFGGQMVRGLTRELNVADSTIEVLAKADFAKTRALTNRFDRPEIRVLAKMMVLRAVLKPKEAKKVDDKIDLSMDEDTDIDH